MRRSEPADALLHSVVGCGRGAVLVVADVTPPSDRTAGLVVLLHGDVDHEAVRRGAVPVVLARLEEDAVAGADDLDRAALALAQADALRHPERLAEGVGVPGGAGAWREVDAVGADARRRGRRGDGVDEDRPGEPLPRTGGRLALVPDDL